jgi:biopolymer transport protein TolR
MRRMARRFKATTSVEINIVPYIDVMLVLLIIFMVTAPLLQQGVSVDLPKAQAKAITQEKDPIILSIDSEGQYYLNFVRHPNVPMDKLSITHSVQQELKADSNRKILVKGDKNIDYGSVIQAMVLLQQAGAGQVGLMTENPTEKI